MDDNAFDDRYDRDTEREPVRRPRIRPQLTGRGSLRVQFEKPAPPDWLRILRESGAL